MRIFGILLLSAAAILQISCGGGGSDGGQSNLIGADPVSGNSSGVLNGPLSGDIWFSTGSINRGETNRFNLDTGVTTKVTSGWATPSRDGTKYTLYRPNAGGRTNYCNSFTDRNRVEIWDTQSQTLEASFNTTDEISRAPRLSPDGTSIMTKSNEAFCFGQTSEEKLQNIAVYSTSGETLQWYPPSIIAGDWLPDGRIALIQILEDGTHGLLFQTEPGSSDYAPTYQYSVSADSSIGTGSMTVNNDGTKILIEQVTFQTNFISSVTFRYSNVQIIDLTQDTMTDVFLGNESDGTLRASAGVFSPDGDWILTTHDYSTGIIGTVDSGLRPQSGITYVVPVTAEFQQLPPNEFSDSIRPLIRDNGNRASLNPFDGQTWTPAIR